MDAQPVTPGADARAVAQKTFRGGFAIGLRQIVVQGSRILGGIFLARLLTPAEFGFYAIILYFQSFLTAFGDAGLAASLVRQPEEPRAEDFRAIFTVQQIIVLATTSVLWIAAPFVATRYHLSPQDGWMFRWVLVSFVVTSFMVVPRVLLERHLEFRSLAVIEATQAIVFNGVAVYLAWRGFGAYSFVWALLVRAVLGTILAYWIRPWRIGWLWNWSLVREHLSFGLSYQGIQVTSLIKDSITPVLIGILLGPADVGYVTWASVVAAYPVMVLLVLQRLYMPAFSRLQHQKKDLTAMAENVVWATNVITAPLATLTLTMIVPITIVVYGQKWLVALPYFFLLWPANVLVSTATPAMGLLNALGKSKVVLFFAVIWMAGTWLVGAPLIWLYGPIGFAIATLVVQISNFWLFRAAQEYAPFRIFPVAAPVWALAILCSGAVYAGSQLRAPHNLASIILYGISGLLLYGIGIFLIYRRKVRTAWSFMRPR